MKKIIITILVVLTVLGSIRVAGVNLDYQNFKNNTIEKTNQDVKYIKFHLNFSEPKFEYYNNSYEEYIVVKVPETNHNMITPGKPVLPVNYQVFELPFGTQVLDINYTKSKPITVHLSGQVSFGKASFDTLQSTITINKMDELKQTYPNDWVLYYTGGGLSEGKHTTFLVIRVFPVRYHQSENQLQYITSITVNVTYLEPEKPLLNNNSYYDLLIISPSEFAKNLERLASHKESFGIKTRISTLEEVYSEMYWYGRDKSEKIKYYIKTAIENWGIKYVLLVGGIKGQTNKWILPVRYSHVVPLTEQEYAEQSFISDLYYADIYDSSGDFSSWDSNNDNEFSVWNETFHEKMDLYPDVYLGRLPCRTNSEVKTMVNKIIVYEKPKSDTDWFKNLILVAGDSYNDTNHYNEGELICEKAKTLMPDFNPIEIYAHENNDINRKTVNKAMNQGAGFAYFCGHGSSASWSTHFPPDGTNWTTGYEVKDMIFLRNGYKLPITVVGGCHNGQFDVTMWNILLGIKEYGLKYFSIKPGNIGRFWYGGWTPNCWAWWLTSKIGGGSIATIANTGLGTHGDGDQDNNGIPDYLEILDGWLELRFLELYGSEGKDNLGENHGETLTGYLHRFLGDDSKMDVKMIQQWELFGDPSLKIGGYK